MYLVILLCLLFCGFPATVISGEVSICSVEGTTSDLLLCWGRVGLAFTGFTFCVSVLNTPYVVSVKLS